MMVAWLTLCRPSNRSPFVVPAGWHRADRRAIRNTHTHTHERFIMAFPTIKDVTLLAVIEKAMQDDPTQYCGKFLAENPETAETISAFAVEMARSWFESEDTAEIVMQSTLLSSVMFMTYEMVKAEVEAKELEEQWG